MPHCNSINKVSDNTGATDPAQYQADAFVYQLDRDGSALRAYHMYDIFPTQKIVHTPFTKQNSHNSSKPQPENKDRLVNILLLVSSFVLITGMSIFYLKDEGFFDKADEEITTNKIKQKITEYYKKKSNFKIEQYDLDNSLLDTYYSYSDASRKANINKTYLTRVLNNKTNNIAKGFIWKKICINALTEN